MTSTLTAPRKKKMAKISAEKTVKIERTLADRIQVVASHRGESIPDYLSNLVREEVNLAYEIALKEMQEQLEAEKKKVRDSKKRKPTAS